MHSTPRIPNAAIPATDILLRELNHRVKNNLQIIVSLINLKKRLAPPDRWDDIRFIEEHVQAMAVAYRLVYATGSMNEVSIGDLLVETVSELRQIAKLGVNRVRLEGATIGGTMGLDQAIALGMYLAVVLPPYLDGALARSGHVSITAELVDNLLTLLISGSWPDPVLPDLLRERLSEAYTSQLQAKFLSAPGGHDLHIRFHLDDRRLLIVPSRETASPPELTGNLA